ncbi:TetR/AcrR family transcriptional regulator [Rhodococcus sp. CH91]|uniref:TetR/AcrR family transcriptional regulator n=1 Tax=Rhodococcus sp. CH91 TaxID=2910256 RepID=UPI001F4A8EA4|nr:TetR family transcriptional regulator [Rhodococcus sp. CH91]
MSQRKRSANDPDRRERIIEAALEVIAERGVHMTTHRHIAERAQVPLGSVTYYFDNLTQILEEAFRLLARTMSDQYHAALAEAVTHDQICSALTELVCGNTYATPLQMTAMIEMYSYSAHNAAVAGLTREWMDASRGSLSLHFQEPLIRTLDALIEGWTLHRFLEQQTPDRRLVLRVIDTLTREFEE